MMDTMAMFTMFVGAKALTAKAGTAVPEPEFTRFQLSSLGTVAVRAEAMAPANTSREPRSLGELGVPSALARELEQALLLTGHVKGDRVAGFTFRTTDGASWALKISKPSALPGAEAGDLAA